MNEKAELLQKLLNTCKQAQNSILASMMISGVTEEKIADLIQTYGELIRTEKEMAALQF
jgi:hypothetical protein